MFYAKSPKCNATKFLTVVLLIAILSVLHYMTPAPNPMLHGLLRFLYYIPILIAVLSFGRKGGLKASILIVAIYTPHIIIKWGAIPLQTFEALCENRCRNFIQLNYTNN